MIEAIAASSSGWEKTKFGIQVERTCERTDPSNDGNIILVEYSFCASNTKVLKMKKG